MSETAETRRTRQDPLAMLAGGGEMGERTRALDWSKTPLGPVGDWPQGLKTAVRIMLYSRQPMFVWWGPELTHLYNDACIPLLGPRYPRALGRAAPQVWSDLWPVLGPQAEVVLHEGRATRTEELPLVVERDRRPEEAYFTFSYSPIPDDEGGEGGVFGAVTEDTQRVLSQRRLRTLRVLAEHASEAKTAEGACAVVAAILAENPHDLPFTLLYLLDGDGREARLAGATGLGRDTPASPIAVELEDKDAPWPFRTVAETGRVVQVEDLRERFGPLLGGASPESPQRAIVLPMTKPGETQLAGFVVAGVSPRLALTDEYRAFMDLLASHVATAVAHARAHEEARSRPGGEPPERNGRLQDELEELRHAATSIDALRASEERLRLAVDATGLGTYDFDVETQRSTWSDRLKEIIGVHTHGPIDPQQELVARIHPDDRDRFLENMSRAFDPAGSGSHDIEFRIVRDDGETCWLRNVGRVVFTEAEGCRRPVRAVGTVRDVTQRSQPEEQLRTTLESIGDGFFACDRDWRFVYVNAVAERLLGISRTEVLGKDHWAVFPLTLGTQLEVEYRRAASGETRDFESFYEPWGRWFHNRCFPREGGGMSVYFQDITDRKRAEAALCQSEAKLSAIIERLPVGIGVVDAAGHTLSLNPAGLCMHGFASLDEMLVHLEHYRAQFELYYPDGRLMPAEEWPLARAIRGEYVSDYEVRLRRRPGSEERVVSYSAVPVPGGSHGTGLTVFVMHDITDRRRTQEALQRTLARSEAIFNQMTEGLVIFDPAGNLLDMNPAALAMHGFETIDSLRRHLDTLTDTFELFDLDGRPLPTEDWPIGRVLRGETFSAYEVRARQRDTGKTWIGSYGGTLVHGPGGEPSLAIVTLRDVTAQREAEEALRRAHGLIEGITQGTEDLIAAEDGEFRYLFFNDAYRREFERLWGRDIELGMSMVDALAPWPEDQRKARDLWSRALDGESFSVTTEFGPSEAERQVYDLRFNPVHDAQGRRIGAAHILRNVTERVRIQQALRQSEATLGAILDALPVGVIIADAQGGILRDNAAYRELWGVSPETTSWRQYGEWVGYWPQTGRRIEAHEWGMARALLKGEVIRGELVECEQFGTKQHRFFLNNAAPIRDADGVIVAGVVAELDVTERLVAERALQESEERFRKVFENAAMGIAITDWNGRFQQCNPAYSALLGYTEEELRRIDFDSLVHPDDREANLVENRRLKAGEVPFFEIENRYVRKDTKPVWVRKFVSILRDETGKPAHLMALVTDVTERRRAEEVLSESESFYRQTLESIPGMTFTGTPDGAYDYVSEQWAEFTGVPAAEQLGEGWLQCVHPDDRARVSADWRAAVDGHGQYDLEYRVRGRDGGYEWFKVRGRAIRDAAGAVVRWFGTAVNVDDIKRAEAALREADRRKDAFLATLAHELRNPLAPLRNGLEVLKLARNDVGTREQVRAMMERQLGQMVRLVDDLLDVSRISRGKIELRKERVELATVVQSAVETVRPVMEQAGHELTVSVPTEPILVDADVTRLAQVLSNLLNNAAKFTERGGHVSLTVERQGDEVVVAVRDDGMGIPAHMLPRVFDLFTQVHRSLEKSQSGLGIGLTLVKQLVEMHDGSVAAKSEGPGTGSEFAVRLPTMPSPAADAQPEGDDASADRDAGRRRILVVDDNKDAADSLAMLLKTMGNATQIAYDGLAALDAGAAFRPDVIVLDIGMPKLNGYETAKRVRQQPWGKHAVLVALTGWGQEDDKRRSHEAGFDHHLVKPIDVAALERLLGELQ